MIVASPSAFTVSAKPGGSPITVHVTGSFALNVASNGTPTWAGTMDGKLVEMIGGGTGGPSVTVHAPLASCANSGHETSSWAPHVASTTLFVASS